MILDDPLYRSKISVFFFFLALGLSERSNRVLDYFSVVPVVSNRRLLYLVFCLSDRFCSSPYEGLKDAYSSVLIVFIGINSLNI